MSLPRVRGAGGGGGGGGRPPYEASDNLRSIQKAHVLDLLCEGPIVGLVNGAKSIYLDETPLQAADGSFNFENVTYVTRAGTQDQTYVEGFSTAQAEQQVQVEVTYGTPVVRQITNPNATAARVTFSLPALQYQDSTTGDLVGSTVALKIELQSNGGGYTSLSSGEQITSTPLNGAMTAQTPANTKHFRVGWTWTDLTERPDGSNFPIPAYSGVLEYRLLGAPTWTVLAQGNPTYLGQTMFSSPPLEAGTYEIRLTDTDNDLLSQGSLTTLETTTLTDYMTIAGKTTTRYQRSVRFPLTGSPPWDIRLTRITPDSTTTRLQNRTVWDSYTEIVDGKFRYPNSALVGIMVDAAQFRAVPRRGYEVKLLQVQVPSNYNPTTRVYTGVWDGTFQTAWTDNPAWVFYDLVTESRYGLGDYVPAALVDKWTLYSIAQYCDELVPDGYGGTEPRFTCNLYLQEREEAVTVLQHLVSIFRGMLLWAAGTISVSNDAPGTPIALITNANVVEGLFTYSGSASRARHTVALVNWNDPADMYRQKPEYVEDFDGISRYGVNILEITAMGCTSRGQAHRLGKWALYTERSETDTVTFRMGLDARMPLAGDQAGTWNLLSAMYPGALIKVHDRDLAGVRFGGRMVAVGTSSITVDGAVTIENGKTYNLSCVMPDGSIETKPVTNTAGTYTVLNVSPAFSGVPQVLGIWILEASDLSPRQFRILSVTETDGKSGLEVQVVALEHDPGKFSAVEQGLVLDTPVFSRVGLDVDPVTHINVSESLYLAGGSVRVRAEVAWGASPQGAYYSLSYRRAEGQWQTLANTSSLSVQLDDLVDDTYFFRVTAYNMIGRSSRPLEVSYDIVGKTAPPPNVSQFLVTRLADGTRLFTWTLPNPPLDLAGYEIRWTFGASGVWESMTPLHTGILIASPYETNVLAAGTYSFAIKAIDTSGNYSQTATFVNNLTIGDPRLASVLVAYYPAQQGWPGTKTNCHVELESGWLLADDQNAWSNLTSWTNWTQWNQNPFGSITYEHPVFDLGSVVPCTPLISFVGVGTPVIEESHSTDGVSYSSWAAAGSVITARYVKVRVTVTGAYPKIQSLPILIDGEVVSEDANDVDSSTLSGTTGDRRLAITQTYAVIRQVVVTLQSVGPGWTWELIDKDTSLGPRVKIYNSGGSLADATIDYYIRGQ